jgi:ribosomal protein L7/L12
MMNPLLAECEELLSRGQGFEAVVSLLRERGLSKVESISALASAARLPLAEAKRIVHSSPTWQDARAAGEELHEIIDETTRSDDAVTRKRD